jgi:hypothetical protein
MKDAGAVNALKQHRVMQHDFHQGCGFLTEASERRKLSRERTGRPCMANQIYGYDSVAPFKEHNILSWRMEFIRVLEYAILNLRVRLLVETLTVETRWQDQTEITSLPTLRNIQKSFDFMSPLLNAI